MNCDHAKIKNFGKLENSGWRVECDRNSRFSAPESRSPTESCTYSFRSCSHE